MGLTTRCGALLAVSWEVELMHKYPLSCNTVIHSLEIFFYGVLEVLIFLNFFFKHEFLNISTLGAFLNLQISERPLFDRIRLWPSIGFH